MKKLFVLGIIAVMVMGMAVSAMATGDTWYVNIRASKDAATLVGNSSAKFGFKASGSDTYAYLQSAYDAAGSPEIEYYDAAHSLPTAPATDSRWYVAQVVKPASFNVYDWQFQVSGAASGSVYLTLWNPVASNADLDAIGASVYTVKLYSGTVSDRGECLFTFDNTKNGAWSSTSGISGNYFQQLIDLDANGKANYFLEAVPEPGSMVALLSGLVGLVGFGVRRKK